MVRSRLENALLKHWLFGDAFVIMDKRTTINGKTLAITAGRKWSEVQELLIRRRPRTKGNGLKSTIIYNW